MRWMLLFCLLGLPVCSGCDKGKTDAHKKAEGDQRGFQVAKDAAPPADKGNAAAKQHEEVVNKVEFVAHQDQPAPEKKDKVEKPRKIRYTADMKLIIEKLDTAEEALDAACAEAKGHYEKADVNRSANTVRGGTWRVRVPVDNLQSFRKAVKKIGDVDRDTLESEDITAKYYDLDAHLANRKAEQKATRELLLEFGKKDTRYMEIKRELDAISDDINRKEGQLKLWADLSDLTTFTIHMHERQPYVTPAKVVDKEIPTFAMRASTNWDASWNLFLGFCQGVAIVAIYAAPWLPIALVLLLVLWLVARRLARAARTPVAVEVVEESPEAKKA